MTNTTQPRHLAYVGIGEHRGAKRIYLQNPRLLDSGFAPGDMIQVDFAVGRIVIRKSVLGDRTVSQKQKAGRTIPVIDISTKKLEDAFGDAERVRILYKDGSLEIDMHPIERALVARERKAVAALEARTVRLGSVCTGLGVMDAALHEGLREAGMAGKSEFAVEINADYLDFARMNNSALARTMTVEGSLDEIEPEMLPEIDFLAAGLPCTAVSASGRAKRTSAARKAGEDDRLLPEDDPNVGHLFVPWLNVIRHSNPSVVLLENVPLYSSTAGMLVVRTMLDKWGYRLFECELDGALWELEARKRFCMVAISRNIAPDGLEVRASRGHATISEILEPIPADSSRWNAVSYLKAKEVRDAAAGKGFKRYEVTPAATEVGTIGRGYYKWRSTEPMLVHPTNADLVRLFTPVEHARLKGIPEGLVSGLSDTAGHEVLGQSIAFGAFRAMARAIGEWWRTLAPSPAFALG